MEQYMLSAKNGKRQTTVKSCAHKEMKILCSFKYVMQRTELALNFLGTWSSEGNLES